jgi:hypothetical protein
MCPYDCKLKMNLKVTIMDSVYIGNLKIQLDKKINVFVIKDGWVNIVSILIA